MSLAGRLAYDWKWVSAVFDDDWPRWVSNLANVVQIVAPVIGVVVWWLTRLGRARSK
jgi:hypothetical protein